MTVPAYLVDARPLRQAPAAPAKRISRHNFFLNDGMLSQKAMESSFFYLDEGEERSSRRRGDDEREEGRRGEGRAAFSLLN